ncbi:hypothetical protein PL9631_110108 [Planktothrix paucivesiculata PCC 9631]|uniref:Uncharacterized protein n=1 Tax=Planktothrix paucivesiculata PCC 9631 TaxID=671071 RepID=A0A7Z9BID9_9CYAN|nr:hypothetical protein PL9631_110108 [Planktothrix paucivesiculata PCC 9631]
MLHCFSPASGINVIETVVLPKVWNVKLKFQSRKRDYCY